MKKNRNQKLLIACLEDAKKSLQLIMRLSLDDI